MLGEQFRDVLQERKKKYIDQVERPSKYEPEPTEPVCMKRESKFMKFEPNNKQFGDSTHTSWETFQKTMQSPFYQTVIRGGSTGQFRTTIGNRYRFSTNTQSELPSPKKQLTSNSSLSEHNSEDKKH